MPEYCLYQMPGSCSRVVLNALEEIGVEYSDKGVALMRGEHFGSAFRALNPKSKVPVLVADGAPVTELPAILYYLAKAHPASGLLPMDADGRATLESLSDMIWMAGGLHPLASRMFRPGSVSEVDPDGVKLNAMRQLAAQAGPLSARLSTSAWWYGKAWSIVDTFVEWIYGVAVGCGFDMAPFAPLAAHGVRVRARQSFLLAQQRERACIVRDGLEMPPGMAMQAAL